MCRSTDESSCKNYHCVVLIIQDIAQRNVFLSQSLYAKNKTVRGKKNNFFVCRPSVKNGKKRTSFDEKVFQSELLDYDDKFFLDLHALVGRRALNVLDN